MTHQHTTELCVIFRLSYTQKILQTLNNTSLIQLGVYTESARARERERKRERPDHTSLIQVGVEKAFHTSLNAEDEALLCAIADECAADISACMRAADMQACIRALSFTSFTAVHAYEH